MEAYQQRVCNEYLELSEKIDKLALFIGERGYRQTDAFNSLAPVDRELLQVQYCTMVSYAFILTQRIARW